MEIRNAAIVGLGALGTMYAHYMTKKLGERAVSIIADAARCQRYKKDGVFCNGERCHFTFADGKSARPVDLVIFAVKFGGLQSAMEEAAPFIGEDTIILSLLNGISSEDFLAECFGGEKVLLCVAQAMDATRSGSETKYSHMGSLWIGPREAGQEEKAKAVAAFLKKIGLSYELAQDMPLRLWRKLMLNVGVNQVAAVYETGYGGVKHPGEARDVLIAAMEETLSVGRAAGIALTEEDVQHWLHMIDGLADEGLPSMRQDMLSGRPTEVELFAGTIKKLGARYHVATPVNDLLYKSIRLMEEKK